MYKVGEGREEVVRLLLSKGADVNVKTKGGSCPMDLAAGFKNFKIMEILKKFGAMPVAMLMNAAGTVINIK